MCNGELRAWSGPLLHIKGKEMGVVNGHNNGPCGVPPMLMENQGGQLVSYVPASGRGNVSGNFATA